MPYKATGRPTGRPQGRKSDATLELEQTRMQLEATVLSELTEEQIQAITPREMFRLVALVAVRTQNMPLILKAAEAWTPYEIPRLASEVHRVFADDSQHDTEDTLRSEHRGTLITVGSSHLRTSTPRPQQLRR